MFLIILSYIAAYQGDFLKMKSHLISCRARISSKDSLFRNILFHSPGFVELACSHG